MGQLASDLVMDGFGDIQYKGQQGQPPGDWYRINGAIYIIGIDEFRSEKNFKPPGSIGFVMPRERSIDVDTPFDFELAELLMSKRIASE